EVIERIDGIEAVNGHSYLGSFNRKAFAFGLKNNMAMTGGSDAHMPEEIGNAFTLIEGKTAEDLRKAIKQKKTFACGRIVPLYHHAFTQLARMNLIKDGD
ncbi:hypothetical protein HZB89_01050, partial [archaeon]|nr:hypothetical protein [archaeon]